MKKQKNILYLIIIIILAATITGCDNSYRGYPTYQEYVNSTLVSYNIIGVTRETKVITNGMGGIIRNDYYYTVLYSDSVGNQNCETFNDTNYGINVILSTENRLDKTCEAIYINLTAETMNSMR